MKWFKFIIKMAVAMTIYLKYADTSEDLFITYFSWGCGAYVLYGIVRLLCSKEFAED